jgi:hypothetical protein
MRFIYRRRYRTLLTDALSQAPRHIAYICSLANSLAATFSWPTRVRIQICFAVAMGFVQSWVVLFISLAAAQEVRPEERMAIAHAPEDVVSLWSWIDYTPTVEAVSVRIRHISYDYSYGWDVPLNNQELRGVAVAGCSWGLPFRMVHCYQEIERRDNGDSVRTVGVLNGWRDPMIKLVWWQDLKHIPYLPIWTGIFLNMIFYGMLFWLVHVSVKLARGITRRRRGRCVACGYPLRAGVVCSECGGVAGKTDSSAGVTDTGAIMTGGGHLR